MSMVESGFVNYWKKVHFKSSRCAAQAASVELGATQLDDMSGLFVVFCFGGLLAAASLLGEVLLKRWRDKQRKRSYPKQYLEELKYAAELAQTAIPFSAGLEQSSVISSVSHDIHIDDIPNDNMAYYDKDTWQNAEHHVELESRGVDFTEFVFDTLWRILGVSQDIEITSFISCISGRCGSAKYNLYIYIVSAWCTIIVLM